MTPRTTHRPGQGPDAEVARFWAKVEKSDGCWLWTASLVEGYGRFYRFGSINAKAHRFSFELAAGPIPDGMLVCHTCDNRKCVRPEHLFLGTPSDNMRDAVQKGRLVTPTAGRAPHVFCRRGHPLTPENRVSKGGCRICNNAYRAAWMRRKRAQERSVA